jgi:hypothetical protein
MINPVKGRSHRSRLLANSKSKQTGSALLLVILMGYLTIMILMAFIWFSLLMVAVTKSRTMAEENALSLAAQLNKNDRIGELNQMIGYSRQLVFSSRRIDDKIQAQYPHLKQISALLVEDARTGAKKTNQEFEFLRVTAYSEALAMGKGAPNKAILFFRLPLLEVEKPKTESIVLGTIDSIPSNARLPVGLNELKTYDLANHYNEQNSQFYRSKIDAKLPLPDNDLIFNFSSLPPSIDSVSSQLRLVHPGVFRKTGTMQRCNAFKLEQSNRNMPCAVQLNLSTLVKLGPASLLQSEEVAQQAVACTNGAVAESK